MKATEFKNYVEKMMAKNAEIEINYTELTNGEKLDYLKENATKQINDNTKYSVVMTIEQKTDESRFAYLAKIEKVFGFSKANEANENNLTTVSGKAFKYGKDLTIKEQITILEKSANIQDGKFTKEILGGQNFVDFLSWVRNLSENEFSALIK